MTDEEPKDWKTLEPLGDIRLVVADMDGTLLDADGRIPLGFKPMLDRLTQRGVRFVPASGRQYQTLEKMFADNGNVVARDGKVIETHGVSGAIVDETIAMTERTSDDLGLVICALGGAYVSRDDAPFIAEASKYYTKLTVVPDLREVLRYKDEQILKLAIFDFGDAQAMAERELGFVTSPYTATASSPHWVDIMDGHVDKGEGVKALQRALGVTRAQTMVFGDYPNDIGMLREGEYSFAMANAHPQVKKVSHYVAGANT